MSSSLTKQQQTTLVYIVGFVFALIVAGGLLYNLSTQRSQVAKLKQEVERNEHQARNYTPPSAEEEAKWAEQETQLGTVLLNDSSIQQFFEEVTRAGADNGIQGLGLTTEEVTIDATKAEGDDAKVLGVGVTQYLAVTLKFRGQYPDIARFMGAISKLPRPIEFYSMNMKRQVPVVDVQIVLHVYKRAAA